MKEKIYIGLGFHEMKLIRRELAELIDDITEHVSKGCHLDCVSLECYHIARSLCDRIDEHLNDLKEDAV